MTGNAICQAAKNFVKEVSTLIASHFKVSLESVVYSSGEFKVVRNKKVYKIRLSELRPFILEMKETPVEVKGDFTSHTTSLNQGSGQGDPYPTYSYSTQIAEVKVDTRTGKVHVVNIISATDVGKAINPETIEGQIVGGAIMGFGYGVMEEYIPNQTKNLREYLIPTSRDAPRIFPIIIEESESSGPFGAKGIGEIVSVPTAAAIANAVNDAIGIRFYQLPITAERVYMALKGKKL
jgi:CO/xanthine dehydrogenase Mo-binding subunit